MKLFNKGHRVIHHAESHKPGSACTPQKVFSVSDELGAKLKKMYPKELENLDDVSAKFAEQAPEKAPAETFTATPVAPDSVIDTAEKEEADFLGISVDELRELKA
jgi:hypothetical protein